jgi:hypothetical protein
MATFHPSPRRVANAQPHRSRPRRPPTCLYSLPWLPRIRSVAQPRSERTRPKTIDGVYRRLVSVLEAAVHNRKIAHSPAVKIKLPTINKNVADSIIALGLDDVRRIADAAPPWMTTFVWTVAALIGHVHSVGIPAPSVLQAEDNDNPLAVAWFIMERLLGTAAVGPLLVPNKTPGTRRAKGPDPRRYPRHHPARQPARPEPRARSACPGRDQPLGTSPAADSHYPVRNPQACPRLVGPTPTDTTGTIRNRPR